MIGAQQSGEVGVQEFIRAGLDHRLAGARRECWVDIGGVAAEHIGIEDGGVGGAGAGEQGGDRLDAGEAARAVRGVAGLRDEIEQEQGCGFGVEGDGDRFGGGGRLDARPGVEDALRLGGLWNGGGEQDGGEARQLADETSGAGHFWFLVAMIGQVKGEAREIGLIRYGRAA